LVDSVFLNKNVLVHCSFDILAILELFNADLATSILIDVNVLVRFLLGTSLWTHRLRIRKSRKHISSHFVNVR